MQKSTLALILGAAVTLSTGSIPQAAGAKPVPCEDMLKQVRAEIAVSKVAPADLANAKAAEQSGIDRCAADDDSGADGHFADSLKLLGK